MAKKKKYKLFYLFFGPWVQIWIPDPVRIRIWIRNNTVSNTWWQLDVRLLTLQNTQKVGSFLPFRHCFLNPFFRLFGRRSNLNRSLA